MKQIYLLTIITIFILSMGKVNAQTVWTGPVSTFTKAASADWTLEANQDRLTDNVWLTRQNNRPIYNYKWWQDNFGQDPTSDDLEADFNNNTTILSFTPSGGTKGIKWALLDDTGSRSDWTGFNFATLGNSANFYSFNNIIKIIEILETETGDFSTISSVDDFTVNFEGSDFSGPGIGNYIVGKKFGIWLVDDDIYLTIIFNSWGSSGGAFSYDRSTDQSLNTNEFELDNKVKLFPNPTSNFIEVSGLTKIESFRIYNILGVKVKNGNISDNQRINIQDLSDGLYFLKFREGKYY